MNVIFAMNGQNPHIDFKMSNLKPHIYGFTHVQ
jgi:hypothetical protein